jgi:hypothetical protein
MFLLDPDEALSREELLQKIWHVRFTQAHRDQVLEIAAASGCTWLDILREKSEEADAVWNDPIQRVECLRKHEEMDRRLAMPYGPDPMLMGKDDTR